MRLPRVLRRLPPLWRRMVLMVVAVGIVVGLIMSYHTITSAMLGRFMARRLNQPQVVSTVVARRDTWQPQIDVVGTLKAVKGADLSLEVPGIVDEIDFHSGVDVEAGTPLIRLRDADDVAKLQSLKASANLAALNYARDERQAKTNAISKAALDLSAATLRQARAAVDEQQAVVDKKTLRAPFAGHLGIRMVNIGQYITAGTAIVTLQALDPIYLDFTLPQSNLNRVKIGDKIVAHVDTFPGETFTGAVSAINPKVDPDTRNVSVRATLPNSDHRLLPGMYTAAELATGASENLITLPQTAVTFNPYGSTVFIVTPQQNASTPNQLIAEQTFVTTGPTRGDQIAILKGVKQGDVVVSAGQLKLQNGMPIAINNQLQPANSPNPKPQEQ